MRHARDPSPGAGVSRRASETQGSSEDSLRVKYHPVDRGWAWIIMIGVFVIHFLTTGYLRSFGLLFVEFTKHFQSSSTITATMSGIQMLAYSLGTFVTMNILMNFISVKTSCLIGCCLELMSVVGNALVTDIKQLIFTHGILFGFGQALMYCPAMVILSEYFDKRRPIATVFATGGVSAGGIAMPFLIQYLVESYGLIGGILITAGVIFQQAVFISFFTSPSDYNPAEVKKGDECNGEDSASKLLLKEKLPKDNGMPVLILNNHVKTAPNQQDIYAIQSNSDSPVQHSHQTQDFSSMSQALISKDCAHNRVSDSEEVITPGVHVTPSQLSSPTDTSTREGGSIPSSLYPHSQIEPKNNKIQSYNLIPQRDDGQRYAGEESLLYPKLNLPVTETKNQIHNFLLAPENTIPVTSNQNSKHPHLNIGTIEAIHISKCSLNSTHSFAHSDNHSRTGQDEVDHIRRKSSRGPLHTLGFPSDTLVRAMSTSSVDVLGSAHPISHTGSSLSVRRRGRGSNVDRPSESDDTRRYVPSYRYPRTSRFRLPRCNVPEMFRRPAFWLVAVYFCGGGLASVLPTVFLPPLAESRGLDASYSSHFLVVSAITEMLGRLVPGLVLHFGYMRPSTVGIPSMALCGILLQLVTFFNDFKSLLALSCLIGFFTGAFWAMQVPWLMPRALTTFPTTFSGPCISWLLS